MGFARVQLIELSMMFKGNAWGERVNAVLRPGCLAWISTRPNSPNTAPFFGWPQALMLKVRPFHQGTFTGESMIPEALIIR